MKREGGGDDWRSDKEIRASMKRKKFNGEGEKGRRREVEKLEDAWRMQGGGLGGWGSVGLGVGGLEGWGVGGLGVWGVWEVWGAERFGVFGRLGSLGVWGTGMTVQFIFNKKVGEN